MTTNVKLPDEIKQVMENGVPAQVGTCSADGIPNVTDISRVYYVDPQHVALSNQFFSKTVRNIRENPLACIQLNDLEGFTSWLLHLEFDHSETEGATFDEMDMQIEAIASMTGMSSVFKLKAADIYRVASVKKIEYGRGGQQVEATTPSDKLRDAWSLLRSDGRIVGTRHLEMWSVSGDDPGFSGAADEIDRS